MITYGTLIVSLSLCITSAWGTAETCEKDGHCEKDGQRVIEKRALLQMRADMKGATVAKPVTKSQPSTVNQLWKADGDCTQAFSKFMMELKQSFPSIPDDFSNHPEVGVEGGLTIEEFSFIGTSAVESKAKTICQTGFNYGTSAFAYLCSTSDDTMLYSWDLGEHDYVALASKMIEREFPGRHVLTLGDSTKTIPEAAQVLNGKECDFVFVDGGHSYDVAAKDIANFKSVAVSNAKLLVDDCLPLDFEDKTQASLLDTQNAGDAPEVKKAFDDATKSGAVLWGSPSYWKYGDTQKEVCIGKYGA